MRGKHRIILDTERVHYDFSIRRNVTVILGDSATGKTTLIDLLAYFARYGEASGVRLQSDVPCFVFTGSATNWRLVLEGTHNSIVFIDEGYGFIFSQDFAEVVRASDNYFVLITRQPIHSIPYSTKEIFGIRSSGKYYYPDKVYHEFYPIYPVETSSSSLEGSTLLLEDSGSGLEFFERALGGVTCISAEGNAKIAARLSEMERTCAVTVIADGAAFGAYVEDLLAICRVRGNTGAWFPESFEWLILTSGMLKSKRVAEILEQPEDYIESSEYFSWEQFFFALLSEVTADDRWMSYSKRHIREAYLTERNATLVLDCIPDEIAVALGIERKASDA